MPWPRRRWKTVHWYSSCVHAENHPYCSSNSFIGARFLNQTQSLLMRLVSLVSLLLPSAFSGWSYRYPTQLLSILHGSWKSELWSSQSTKKFPSILPPKCFQIRSPCVVPAGLQLRIPLPPLLECWNNRLAAPCLAWLFFFKLFLHPFLKKSHPVLRILHSKILQKFLYTKPASLLYFLRLHFALYDNFDIVISSWK